METAYAYLYNIDAAWKETILTDEAAVRQALAGLQDQPISAHAILGDVRRVTYANGTVLYVNDGRTAAQLDGVTVPAMGIGVRKSPPLVIFSETSRRVMLNGRGHSAAPVRCIYRKHHAAALPYRSRFRAYRA